MPVLTVDLEGRNHRRGTLLDPVLSQRRDVGLHSGPWVCTETHLRRRGPHCRLLRSIGQLNSDNDHVKCDGDDGCDLAVEEAFQRVRVSSLSEKH